MLTLVEAINRSGNHLQLPLQDPSAGFVVKKIEGLGPVAASLTTSSIAQLDGAEPQNARRDTRNIVMTLGYQPDFIVTTVQSLRQVLYDYFMTKALVTLNFYFDGSLYAITQGQIEDFTADMFTDDPEAVISIVCYDPDFVGPAAVSTDFDTTSSTDTTTVTYSGTSDVGFVLTISIDRDLSAFTVYNTRPDNTIQVFNVSEGTFHADDVVTLTSVPGMKSLTLTRSGLDSSILYWMDDTSVWPLLEKGDNFVRVSAAGAAIPCTLVYTPKFGGL